MAKKGFTPEQIINKLREAELLLQQGATIAAVSKSIGVSTHTYYRLRKEYGGLRADQAKKLKTLEKENARLKKLVADLSLDNAILKEVAAAKFDALVDDGFKDQTRETNVSKMFVSQENSPESINRFESEPPGNRTQNLLIKSQLLCQLS
jgi:putative transposase